MSFEMVRAKKIFCQDVFFPKLLHRNNKHCCGIYNFTWFVQLCRHDTIDVWYRFLRQLIMFGEFNDKRCGNIIIFPLRFSIEEL